ncbi:MAG: tetratricopeptide repeat protein [Methylobacter sp.]|nr:tetratricopeptide repeat protein [Methylobacter sp.]
MKNKTVTLQHCLMTITVGLLASSSLVMAANFDLLSPEPNTVNNPGLRAPLNDGTENSHSILESFQQAEIKDKKENYLEALDLLRQNRLAEAGKKISTLLKQNPDEPEFYNLQALLDTLEKDTASAEQSYQKAIQLDPKNILAHLGVAKLALENGNLDKAKDYANKTLAINEKTINAYLLLADIASKEKNNEEVENILLIALEKVKGNVTAEIEAVKNLGKFYASRQQPEKALSLSDDLVKRYPNNSSALSILAQAQIVNNKKPAAEETLHQVIDQEKQDIYNRLLLAKLLSEHPDKEKEVFKLFDEAAEIAPDKPEGFLFKAAYLIKLKRYTEALELANKIDTLFPKLGLGTLLKGEIYVEEKKWDKALDTYQQAYQIQPNDKIMFTIVDLMTVQKKIPDAIKFLNDELVKHSKKSAVHFKLATVYQQQNDYKQAETHYKAMLAEQPDNALGLNNLAWIYSQQNNPQAIELAKKAYTQAPESAAIVDTYGYILIKQGEEEEGLAILEKAVALAPQVNDIQFHLAEAYAANDNKKKAIEILETIGKSEQNFPEKKAAASLLDKLKGI